MFYGLITNKQGQATNYQDWVTFTYDASGNRWISDFINIASPCTGFNPRFNIVCTDGPSSEVKLLGEFNDLVPTAGVLATVYADPLYAEFDVSYTGCDFIAYTLILTETHP